jgi:hypothetical protein
MKDEASLALEQLLASVITPIRAEYRKAVVAGMKMPIVAVLDARDPKGRKILEGITGTEAVRQLIEKMAREKKLPLGVSTFPLEKANQILGPLTSHGRKELEAKASKPGAIPILIITRGGVLCTSVPEMDEP